MATNLVSNSGFEKGSPIGWNKYYSGSPVFSFPEVGNVGSSAAISFSTATVGTYGYLSNAISANIDASKTYVIYGALKTNNIVAASGTGGGANIRVDWRDTNWNLLRSDIASTTYKTGTISWTWLQRTLTPPSNAVHATVAIIIKDCSGKAWFDDISLKATGSTTELVYNGYFGLGLADSWGKSYTGTPTFSYPKTGRSGGYSVAITSKATDTAYYYSTLMTISASKKYDFSGYMKTEGMVGVGTGSNISIDWKTSTGGWISNTPLMSYKNTNLAWIKYVMTTLTPPSTATRATIKLTLKSCVGKAYFDDISLSETVTGTANIVATGMTLDKTSCQEPCAITANITWKNTGTASGTFTPKVKVDSILYAPYPSQSLAVGVSVTKSFTVSGLTAGSHSVCPDPNP